MGNTEGSLLMQELSGDYIQGGINYSSSSRGSCSAMTKMAMVINEEGHVLEYESGAPVGEVTLQHPHHFICEAEEVRALLKQAGDGNGELRLIKMLAQDEALERGKLYALLPNNIHLLDTKSEMATAILSAAAEFSGSARNASKPSLSNPVLNYSNPVSLNLSEQCLERVLLQLTSNSNSNSGWLSKTTSAGCLSPRWKPPLETIYEYEAAS